MRLEYEPASEPLHNSVNRAQLNNLCPEQVMYLEQGGLTLPDTSAYLMESKAAQPRALAGRPHPCPACVHVRALGNH